MKIIESSIAGVDILAPHAVELGCRISPEALPFTIVVRNRADRTIALVGVRFDMTGPRAEKYSVVHYADMLRDPAKAELRPGAFRAICAEPSYTASLPDARGKLNLARLQRMLSLAASLDCIAFDDGRFAGPDTQGAFERMNRSREDEAALIHEALAAPDPESLLHRVASREDDRVRVPLARKLLQSGDQVRAAAAAHRCRIPLWRA